ncbi:protein mono-ADP-ribosyltransferase PARP4-like [Dendropsophus ebraccatus]|uniref:protein mono-ADP-ribosyltransferase PARP4-like n=1 Tax=Dendropsophus ebraccatus TaxID=150705 RepID=UPI0038317DEA
MQKRMGAGVFSDCIFFIKVKSLPPREKKKLKNTITLNGGEISFVLNKKCTHAVVGDPATLNRAQQKKIEKHAISVVNPDFIWKLVQEERVREKKHKDYEKSHEVTAHKDQGEKKSLFLAKFYKNETQKRDLEEVSELEDYADNTSNHTEVAKYCCFQKGKDYAIIELLCSTGRCPFPYRISTVYGLRNTSKNELTFHLVDTAEKACVKYDRRINYIEDKGFTQIDRIPLQAENLASKALQKVLLGEAINITELSPEVAGLVGSIWMDALGHLDSILSCPVQIISLNDISKAEGILLHIRNVLIRKNKEAICEMMQEFYRCIPHKEKIQNNINMKFLMAKQDLCQVIRDMINVNENNSSIYTSSSTAKYQALRCRIEHIHPNSAEFLQVTQSIQEHNHSNGEFNILRVFRVGRQSEATNFKSDLGNVKSLLHASSPCNFVGILSRGLLLPNSIVEEFDGDRMEIGKLGYGIYFSDSVSTSIQYSQPSSVTGSRLLMVCDVALGNCADVFRRDYTITEPPNGFHSVHGVRRKDGVKSDFSDDEYVVYDVNQVQMRYVVQFSTDGDCVDLHKESLLIFIDQTRYICKSQPEPSEADATLEVTEGGLEDSDGQQIPLQSIHVKARLMDLVGKVAMFQTYKNESSFPIEAKYVFPLDSTAAVYMFEALINGKHIIGEVKEKQQSHPDDGGHGAYLMDQYDLDAFTVSFGILPPKATMVIKISYVMELQCRNNCIAFSIPGNVAQWQQDKASKENSKVKNMILQLKSADCQSNTPVETTINRFRTPNPRFYPIQSRVPAMDTFQLRVEEELRSLSTTQVNHNKHNLSLVQKHALKELAHNPNIVVRPSDKGGSVVVLDRSLYIKEVEKLLGDTVTYKPLTTHPTDICQKRLTDILDLGGLPHAHHPKGKKDSGKQEQNLSSQRPKYPKPFQLEMSVEMPMKLNIIECWTHKIRIKNTEHKAVIQTQKASYFNGKGCSIEIGVENTGISRMLVEKHPDQDTEEAKPNMGSTEFWKVLQSLYLLRPKTRPHKVLLISDGHVQNENLVFQILNKNKNDTELFTCGVGTTANKHLLRRFAQYGCGAFGYFSDKDKSKWKDQMDRYTSRMYYPVCTDITVKWEQYNQTSSEILQAPTNIPAVLREESVMVYGFVSHCTQATIQSVMYNEEIKTVVAAAEQQKTTGTILHTLTARALIKDYEEGILQEKESENEMKKQEMKSFIIQLSKQYSLVTQVNGFVEDNKGAEEDINTETNIDEMISAEDVDVLPDMKWFSPIIEEDIQRSHHLYFPKYDNLKEDLDDDSSCVHSSSNTAGSVHRSPEVRTLGLEDGAIEACEPAVVLSEPLAVQSSLRIHLAPPSWSSLASLQSPEGYWQLSPELGTLLHINVRYLTEDFLVKKGIRSLGLKGMDTIHKLIATLLVLQIIRVHKILSGIKFKTLLKLDRSVPKSLQHYPSIGKATEWAGRADRQYPGICTRLGLGKDWDQATHHVLGLDPIGTTSDLYSVSHSLFLV